jgi:flavodoxin
MAKIGIFFGSTEGNTERVVAQIQEAFGGEDVVEFVIVSSPSLG